MELTDQELLSSWQNGSDLAFEQIYKRQAPVLLDHAMRKTNDRAVSEELVQDTFIAFYKLRLKSSFIKSLPAYLYTILKNKVLDHYRHQSIFLKYEEHLVKKLDMESYFEESAVEYKELETYIYKNINNLPRQCQKVFKLSREEQLSNKEIARQLNISENTVEQHMRKALRLLRVSLTAFARFVVFILLFKY
ncbi:RNA polymerase sigma-70 factor, ECF subfamily [Mucilaginibacter mallensis]|uniref:RNA polymerase sigma-70 factor, ECF subfamily n=1 Tax=Mucilaginibacter mallensis TaxID=652787 RepID=A0A1H2CCM3_MUCMA|nr:RNA polymerase sigma-70 factor [Mucilaginibacter mallensis]SDT68183.1 RNA polymerase sigma-70 factor, ECF subfamily [Mucilaginibacter mallensis]